MRRKSAYKPQKKPVKKKKWCHALMTPHKCHKLYTSAHKEFVRLSDTFKGSDFEIFECDVCNKYHVGKVPIDDEE